MMGKWEETAKRMAYLIEKRKKRKERQLEYDLTNLKFSDLTKAKKAEGKFRR